jgi:hypothetical protein
MTLDVNVVLADMPGTISAYSVANPDLSYTIVLNSRLNHERQMQAYIHEMNHIKNGDYDRKCHADLIECYAHAST